MTIKITNENFQSAVLEAKLPVLVDFWAEWCGPCRAIGPLLEEISTELESKAIIGKVNVDEQSSLAQKYNIRSIPTLLVFKNGQLTDTHIGMTDKQTIRKLLGV